MFLPSAPHESYDSLTLIVFHNERFDLSTSFQKQNANHCTIPIAKRFIFGSPVTLAAERMYKMIRTRSSSPVQYRYLQL